MKYPLLATQLYGTPLLLEPDKAFVIEAVFRAYAEGHGGGAVDSLAPVPMAAAFGAARYADKPYALTEGGVAIVPMIGTLVHRGSQLDSASGLANYAEIGRLMDVADRDPDVRGILLEADSRGGNAEGAFARGEAIRATQKPVWGIANETALSGGYLLLAAADRVLLPPTARVGSIGVILLHQDRSQANAKAGITYTAIYAGAKKNDGTPHAPLAETARADLQASVDELNTHFIDYVARMRGMDPAAVRATEAGIFTGQAAVDIGLADAVMSFTETLAAFERELAAPVFSTGGFRQPSQGVTTMSNPAHVAAPESPTAEQQHTTMLAAAHADGAKEMQARIHAIQACDEAKGRESLAAHLAFKTTMTADDAKAMLAAAPRQEAPVAAAAANPLATGMAAVTNPAVGTDAPPAEDAQVAVGASWDRAFAKASPTQLRAVK